MRQRQRGRQGHSRTFDQFLGRVPGCAREQGSTDGSAKAGLGPQIVGHGHCTPACNFAAAETGAEGSMVGSVSVSSCAPATSGNNAAKGAVQTSSARPRPVGRLLGRRLGGASEVKSHAASVSGSLWSAVSTSLAALEGGVMASGEALGSMSAMFRSLSSWARAEQPSRSSSVARTEQPSFCSSSVARTELLQCGADGATKQFSSCPQRGADGAPKLLFVFFCSYLLGCCADRMPAGPVGARGRE